MKQPIVGESWGWKGYLVGMEEFNLKRQSKMDFINTHPTALVATWVALNPEVLTMFCNETGYKEWKKEKQEELRKLKFEKLAEEL